MKSDIEKFLNLTGVNSYTIFPDLDGLSRYVNRMGYYKTRDIKVK